MKKSVILSLIFCFLFTSCALAAVAPIPSANPPTASSNPVSTYLQSVKTLNDNKYGENEIKSFVYQVFSLFDRHSDVNQLLLMFADEDLNMRIPEGSIKSHEEFKAWYASIASRYQSNLNNVEKIEITTLKKGEYQASFLVTWQAMGRDGKYISQKFHHTWKLVDGGGYWPRITNYTAEPAY